MREFYCKDCGKKIGEIEDDIVAKCPYCRSLNSSLQNSDKQIIIKKTPGRKKKV